DAARVLNASGPLHAKDGWKQLRELSRIDVVYLVNTDRWITEIPALSGKPSWYDAPPEASHLAQDQCGDWYWYEGEPRAGDYSWVPSEPAAMFTHIVGQGLTQQDWRNTLEARPSDAPQQDGKPSWSDAPEWAEFL